MSQLRLNPSGSTASLHGAVRGGGRLYAETPLAGYSEEEMVREAQLRHMHNRQRRRLKQLLHAASEDGSTVATKDLLLAAKLAKMDLPEQIVAETPYATGVDGIGVPTKISWKPFYSSLPPPPLKGPGGFGELPPLKSKRVAKVAAVEAEEVAAVVDNEPKDDDVVKWFKVLQDKMTTRFAELRRAFRTLDEDASGNLTHEEMKTCLIMFNLGIPENVMDKMIKLADFDGDGTINYAEFARIMTTENVLDMKKTLSAGGWGGEQAGAKVRRAAAKGANVDKETGDNVKLRRTGPGLDAIRRAHKTLRTQILGRYGDLKSCFKEIDADSSGLVRRAELRTFLRSLSKSIPDRVISGLIDYVDTDGDAKTLSMGEFVAMMQEDFLK